MIYTPLGCTPCEIHINKSEVRGGFSAIRPAGFSYYVGQGKPESEVAPRPKLRSKVASLILPAEAE